VHSWDPVTRLLCFYAETGGFRTQYAHRITAVDGKELPRLEPVESKEDVEARMRSAQPKRIVKVKRRKD
jgi:hypothetical protein